MHRGTNPLRAAASEDMDQPKRLRELGLSVGKLPTGPTNTIVDAPGVRVGHCSVRGPVQPAGKPIHTGLTAIVPGAGDLTATPLPAAVDVFNGFGKSAGLMQLRQRGELESPVYLAGTLNVGRVWDAAVTVAMERRTDLVTVNPVVMECNDCGINDAIGRHVNEAHVREALTAATNEPPRLGSVGAGSGMRCLGRKGGIGSASRVAKTKALGEVALGVLTLNNFGGRLTWRGREVPRPDAPGSEASGAGSVIVVVAVAAPLAPILLGRIARRTWAGIARVGAAFNDASGDVALAFTLPGADGHCPDALRWRLPHEDIDALFTAAADATEESVWDCLLAAGDHVAPDGTRIAGLTADELLSVAGG